MSLMHIAHAFLVTVAGAFAVVSVPARSQPLPPVSRDVFKCVVAGNEVDPGVRTDLMAV